MEDILKKKMHPGNRVQDSDTLVKLRFAKGPGVEGRPNLPFWKHDTAILLQAHIEQPIPTKVGVARKLRWIPNFDHAPGAPCGFIAAAKHVVKQDAFLKQEHRWVLMYRQWKIAKPPRWIRRRTASSRHKKKQWNLKKKT